MSWIALGGYVLTSHVLSLDVSDLFCFRSMPSEESLQNSQRYKDEAQWTLVIYLQCNCVIMLNSRRWERWIMMVNYDQPGIGHIIFLVVEANRQDLQRHRELVRRHRAEAEEVQDVLSKNMRQKCSCFSCLKLFLKLCWWYIYIYNMYKYMYIYTFYICYLYTHMIYIYII